MQMSITNHTNTDASIKNIETQVGQIAKQLAKQQGGTFIINTQTNPNEHCKAITTRNGRVIEIGVTKKLEKERVVVEAWEKQEGEQE